MGLRFFEILYCNDIYIINLSMRKYLNVFVVILKIVLWYVLFEDLYQYSIDEFFMDVMDSYYRFNLIVFVFCKRF